MLSDKCMYYTRLKGNQPHHKIIGNPLLQKLLRLLFWKSPFRLVFHYCILGPMHLARILIETIKMSNDFTNLRL